MRLIIDESATPPNIRYFTPEPDPQDEDYTMNDSRSSEGFYPTPDPTVIEDGSVQPDDISSLPIPSLSMSDTQPSVDSHFQPNISPDLQIKSMISLADQYQADGQFDEAERLYRSVIDEMKSEPRIIRWKAQCSLCKLLCRYGSSQVNQDELAQLLFVHWAWVFKHSYSCENGSQLYQITLQLSDIDDTENSSLQRIRHLARELLLPFGGFGTTWKFGSRDPNSDILFTALEIANICSELGWFEVADTMFSVLMGGSLAALDRVGRKFDKVRAYIWYAHHHQRQERWEDFVSSLRDAYRIVTSTLLFSGNAVEYHALSEMLKMAFSEVPPSWRYSTSLSQMEEVSEMDRELDSVLANDRDSKLGIPRLNCDSVGHNSSNSGKYGVTYSDSLMSGISLNYSSLFF